MLEPTLVERRAEADVSPLPRRFFGRPTDEVARDLLGTLLCRRTDDRLTVGRIVETEAYGGPDDLASHARAGLTRRTAPMFGEVGHAYVYLIYGMHECLNVVAHGPEAVAGAILLRALEPVSGTDLMRARRARAGHPDHVLASGPARLCQAMAVDRGLDAHDLTTRDALWLAPRDAVVPESAISVGPRVGVEYAGEWSARPLRFWITGNRSVSR